MPVRRRVTPDVSVMTHASTAPHPERFVQQAYAGRTGLLATLSTLLIVFGFTWGADLIEQWVVSHGWQSRDSVPGYVVRLAVDIGMCLMSTAVAVNFVLKRPLRSAITDGRPFSLKWIVLGGTMGVCICLPIHMGWLWALQAHSGLSFHVPVAGIDPGTWAFFLTLLLLSPLHALGEELIFRGFLTQLLGDVVRARIGLAAIVALLFALVHDTSWISPTFLAEIFAVSLLFSALTFVSGGIGCAVGYHAAGNIIINSTHYLVAGLPENKRCCEDAFMWGLTAAHMLIAGAIFLWLARRR